MDFNQYEGWGEGYKYRYEENETDDKIVITAKIEIDKNSKPAMKRVAKSRERNSSVIIPILQECYGDYKREMRSNQ